jgi:hypothetical protein
LKCPREELDILLDELMISGKIGDIGPYFEVISDQHSWLPALYVISFITLTQTSLLFVHLNVLLLAAAPLHPQMLQKSLHFPLGDPEIAIGDHILLAVLSVLQQQDGAFEVLGWLACPCLEDSFLVCATYVKSAGFVSKGVGLVGNLEFLVDRVLLLIIILLFVWLVNLYLCLYFAYLDRQRLFFWSEVGGREFTEETRDGFILFVAHFQQVVIKII